MLNLLMKPHLKTLFRKKLENFKEEIWKSKKQDLNNPELRDPTLHSTETKSKIKKKDRNFRPGEEELEEEEEEATDLNKTDNKLIMKTNQKLIIKNQMKILFMSVI